MTSELPPPASPTVSFAEVGSAEPGSQEQHLKKPPHLQLSLQQLPAMGSKLSVAQVKRQASSLMSAAAAASMDAESWPGSDLQSSDVILRLNWKLRVHGYLSKLVAACGAVTFALEVLSGFLSPLGARQERLAAALRATHSGEWVGFVLICAGLANVWVKSGRVSLLVAFGASLLGTGFAALGAGISCLLLATYFSLRDVGATQDLLNASLLALFVLLAQLSGLMALLAHTAAYHPYRIFRVANRLRADSAATAETNVTAAPVAVVPGSEDEELRRHLQPTG